MKQLVVLKLKGELDRGFWLSVEIGEEGKYPETEITGDLPPAIDLILQYKRWQSIYRKLEYSFRLKYRLNRSFRLKQDSGFHPIETVTESYIQKQKLACYQAADRLKGQLNKWLDSSGFRRIDRRLREQLNIESEIRILISSESKILKGLPWHLWNILEAYPKAEIAVNSLEYQPSRLVSLEEQQLIKIARASSSGIKILAILGSSAGINVRKDKEALIEQLPNAQITFLEEPEPRQLNDRLWEQSWDILFFAGHSKTEEQTGRIHINNKDSLTIDEIKFGLKKAIAKGLKLAIFNSCDGLGLALELEKLNLPQMVVMREPVPDRVAHKFLSYFLPAFAGGAPLHLAVRGTRERLQGLEKEFPCASWLPVVFQNPAVPPLTWSNLLEQPQESPIKYLPQIKKVDEIINTKVVESKIERTLAKDSQPSSQKQENVLETSSQQNELNWLILKNTLIGCLAIVSGLLIFEFVQYQLFINRNLNSHNSSQNDPTPSPAEKIDRLPQNPPPEIDKPDRRFQDVSGVPRGTFNYGGSNIWETIRTKTEPEIEAAWPEFKIRYVTHPIFPKSSATAVDMILKHQIAIALSSRRLKSQEIQQARANNVPLEQIPVAIDAVVFTVNQNLGINSLSVSQLKDIYSGKISNWQEVGGPNLQIVPYSRSAPKSGTALFFVNNVLDRQNFGDNVKIAANVRSGIDLVANNPGAIFYASAPEIIGQCKTKPIGLARGNSDRFIFPHKNYRCTRNPKERLNIEAFRDASYPLTRYLYVIIEKNANIETQAGRAYVNLLLSQRGQELIEEAGFVPVR